MQIAGPAGALDALIDRPPGGRTPRAAVVFAHPHPQHGGTMHTKAVFQGAKGLARTGCVVLRFNFRGVGTSAGDFGGGPGELDDFRAALDYMRSAYPDIPLWAAGFSFGAWVALESGASDERVSVLVGIAPPVGRPGYSFEGVLASTKPKFLVQGERDEICPLRDMRAFYSRLHEPKELVVIDGADHVFDGKVGEVADAIEDLLGDYE
jgi:alpha/beta superfamily hydrolase